MTVPTQIGSGMERWDHGTTPRSPLFDLGGALRLAWQRRGLVVLVTLAFLALGVIATRQMETVYAANAEVMLNTRKTTVVDVDSVISGLPADSKVVDGEIAVITSTALLGRVVDKLMLTRDAEFNAALRPPTPSERLRGRIVAAMPESLALLLGLVKVERAEDPAAAIARERRSTIRALRRALNVRQRGQSVVILVGVSSSNGPKAALIANTVADEYLADQLAVKFDATEQASGWLSDRVGELRERVEAAEAAVEAFRQQQVDAKGQGSEATEQQIAALNSELIGARAASAEAAARLAQVQQRIDSGGMTSAAEVLSSPLILTLRQQRAELLRRRAELSNRYGERHPTMINLSAEIRDTSGAITGEVRKTVEGLRNDVAVAEAREAALRSSLAELEARSLSLSRSSVGLRQLEREAAAERVIYENFLNRFRETSEQDGLAAPDARVISHAEPPGGPAGPKRGMLTAVSGVVGMAFGLMLVFLGEMMKRGFRLPEEVEAATGLPVLASLPGARKRRRGAVLDYTQTRPASALAEGVRTLRTALLMSAADVAPQVVMVSSALPGEGKTTTSVLLAHLSAQMDRPAIVVECDVRRPALCDAFGIAEDGPDLLSVLNGDASLDEAVIFDEESGVWFLPVHRGVASSADVLASQRFADLISVLRSRFSMVVLDVPPAMLVSDAGVVGKQADAAVFLIRWDHTGREAAVEGIRQLRQWGVRVAGVALTLVDRERAARYAAAARSGTVQYGRNDYYLN